VIRIVGVNDADFVGTEIHQGDDVSAGARPQLAKADHGPVIALNGLAKDFRVKIVSGLNTIVNAFGMEDLDQVFGPGLAGVFIGKTREGFDVLVPPQGFQSAPAASAWRLIAHATVQGDVDFGSNVS